MSAPANAIVTARDLKQVYTSSGGLFGEKTVVNALKGVSFDVFEGETLAIVGESGCGKSTLARILTMIEAQHSGALTIDGTPLNIAKTGITAEMRRMVQIIFQDPYGSLNPRKTVGAMLEEPLIVNTKTPKAEQRRLAREMLVKVGLKEEHIDRYPHMFSGGQRQRIAIARALMLRPKILVLDEPVSALDLSVQAQILNLLADLKDEFNLTSIFISHDLSVVKHICDRIIVMYFGEIVEIGTKAEVFGDPKHAYTRTLFAATPTTDLESIRARIKAI